MPNSALPWYKKKPAMVLLAMLIVIFFFSLLVMIINYSFAGFFVLQPGPGNEMVARESSVNLPPAPEGDYKKGILLTNTMIAIGDDLFSNWLPNDKIWPTVLLDNPQNFQLGQLEMMRYITRVMRDNLTKMESNSPIDSNIDAAFTLLSNDPFKWIMPSAESRYKEATSNYRQYRDRLAAGEAMFDPREDNLKELLNQCASLMGDINSRLANAPNHQRYRISREEVSPAPPEASSDKQSAETKVSWSEIDNNFYYAQGVAYVLRQVMVAVRYEFTDILKNKNAIGQVDRIIESLNQSQFEPIMVLNGDTGSMMANHSLELHSILENARQKIIGLDKMIIPTR